MVLSLFEGHHPGAATAASSFVGMPTHALMHELTQDRWTTITLPPHMQVWICAYPALVLVEGSPAASAAKASSTAAFSSSGRMWMPARYQESWPVTGGAEAGCEAAPALVSAGPTSSRVPGRAVRPSCSARALF